MKRTLAVFLVLGGAACGWAAHGDVQPKKQNKATDGIVLYDEMTKEAKWCLVGDPLHSFVINTKHLEIALKHWGEKLKKLDDKVLHSRHKSVPNPHFKLWFYSWDGKVASSTGEMGFWKFGAGMYLSVPNETGVMAVAKEDWMAFMNEIKPALHNIAHATEALDVPIIELKQLAIKSIAQSCFRESAMKALPRLETFLSDKNESIKVCAAETILKISPSHADAKKVLDKQKQ